MKDLRGNIHCPINRVALLNRAKKAVGAQTVVGLVLKRALPLALAAVCVMLGFIWGANSRKGDTLQRSELTEARACWREVAALFPNQLQAIVFDQRGTHLVLSEKANQGLSAPIYLK